MNNPSFSRSSSGRLLLATGGLNLLAMGLLAAAGPGPHAMVVLAAVPLLSIISCMFVVGLAVDRTDEVPIYLIIALPFLGGLSYAGLTTAPAAGVAPGATLALIGAAAILAAVRSTEEKTDAIAHGEPSRAEA